jgi:NAD-dependent dihydropyrimidine dehydrogenase PreA subunit
MWLKIIAGASHTDVDRVVDLAKAYGPLGIDCLDIAADVRIIDAVDAAWQAMGLTANTQPPRPKLMISLALDDDVHFRKIVLNETACIDCGACVPTCPAEALAMTTEEHLLLDEPRCYGCDRCVPVCPTAALSLTPFLPSDLYQALTHPAVNAVELHTRSASVASLERFMGDHAGLIEDKLISVCFSPSNTTDWWPLVAWMVQHKARYRWMLQVDGQPMSGNLGAGNLGSGNLGSGNANLTANAQPGCLPALQGAEWVHKRWQQEHPGQALPFPLVLSGGIDPAVMGCLANTVRYGFIAGVSAGTVARQWLQQGNDPQQFTNHFLQPLVMV